MRGGANLLDVNMDADLLDGEQAMTTFLNLVATEPEVARIPIMVDSSPLEYTRGRAPNASRARASSTRSSLKEGEAEFLEHARRVGEGEGVVVMAFDEQGQADTCKRKVAIYERAYTLRSRRKPASRPEELDLRPERPRRRNGHRRAPRGFAKAFLEALPLHQGERV